MTDNQTMPVEVIEGGFPIEVLSGENFTEARIDEILKKLRDNVMNVDRDVSDEKGRQNVRSLAYNIKRSKSEVDKLSKSMKADLRKKADEITQLTVKATDGIDAIWEEFRRPLTEYEEKEKTRREAIDNNLQALERLCVVDHLRTLADIEQARGRLEPLKAFNFQEDYERGDALKDKAEIAIDKREAEIKEQLEKDAELERLRAEAAEREAELERLRAQASPKQEEPTAIAVESTANAEDVKPVVSPDPVAQSVEPTASVEKTLSYADCKASAIKAIEGLGVPESFASKIFAAIEEGSIPNVRFMG